MLSGPRVSPSKPAAHGTPHQVLLSNLNLASPDLLSIARRIVHLHNTARDKEEILREFEILNALAETAIAKVEGRR